MQTTTIIQLSSGEMLGMEIFTQIGTKSELELSATNVLEVDFHPTLYANVNLDYQGKQKFRLLLSAAHSPRPSPEGEVFSGDVTADKIWEEDLSDLQRMSMIQWSHNFETNSY